MAWPCANNMTVSGTPKPEAPPSYTHMTFYWSKNSEILFNQWPATCTPMYLVALLFVFALSVLTEFITVGQTAWFDKYDGWYPDKMVKLGLMKTGVQFLRMSLFYLVVLSVMSFNGGVFMVALLGHAVGFLLFSSGIFDWKLLKKVAVAAGYI